MIFFFPTMKKQATKNLQQTTRKSLEMCTFLVKLPDDHETWLTAWFRPVRP